MNKLLLLLAACILPGLLLGQVVHVPGAPQSKPILLQNGVIHLGNGKVVENGGKVLGEIVEHPVEDAGLLTFTYAKDPDGNILELQKWT